MQKKQKQKLSKSKSVCIRQQRQIQEKRYGKCEVPVNKTIFFKKTNSVHNIKQYTRQLSKIRKIYNQEGAHFANITKTNEVFSSKIKTVLEKSQKQEIPTLLGELKNIAQKIKEQKSKNKILAQLVETMNKQNINNSALQDMLNLTQKSASSATFKKQLNLSVHNLLQNKNQQIISHQLQGVHNQKSQLNNLISRKDLLKSNNQKLKKQVYEFRKQRATVSLQADKLEKKIKSAEKQYLFLLIRAALKKDNFVAFYDQCIQFLKKEINCQKLSRRRKSLVSNMDGVKSNKILSINFSNHQIYTYPVSNTPPKDKNLIHQNAQKRQKNGLKKISMFIRKSFKKQRASISTNQLYQIFQQSFLSYYPTTDNFYLEQRQIMKQPQLLSNLICNIYLRFGLSDNNLQSLTALDSQLEVANRNMVCEIDRIEEKIYEIQKQTSNVNKKNKFLQVQENDLFVQENIEDIWEKYIKDNNDLGQVIQNFKVISDFFNLSYKDIRKMEQKSQTKQLKCLQIQKDSSFFDKKQSINSQQILKFRKISNLQQKPKNILIKKNARKSQNISTATYNLKDLKQKRHSIQQKQQRPTNILISGNKKQENIPKNLSSAIGAYDMLFKSQA